LNFDKSPENLNKVLQIFKSSTPKQNISQNSDITLEVSGLSESHSRGYYGNFGMSEINVKKEEDDNSDSDNDILMAGLNKEVKALEDDLPSCPSIQNSQIEELKKSLNMEPRSDNKVNTTLSSGALTLMKSPYLEAPLCISDIEGQSQK
jgi:hypothetical protein